MNGKSTLIPAFSLLLALSPLRAQSNPDFARQLLNRQQYRQAAEMLEDMVARPGASPNVYEMLATAYLGLRQSDKAIAAIEQGLRTSSGYAPLENYYVALLRSTRPRAEVQQKILEALNLYPQSAVFRKAAARLLYEANPQDERAGALLAMAARDLPEDAEVHFFFGQWLCLNQREPACLQELTTASEKTSSANSDALAQIWSLMATAEMNMGRLDDATKMWERAMHANEAARRPSPELNVQYSVFLRKSGRQSEADRALRDTLRRYPDSGPAHFEAAQVALSRNDPETAAREAGKALAFRGFTSEERNNIHLFLASAYASSGRYADSDRERAWVAEHTPTAENVPAQR